MMTPSRPSLFSRCCAAALSAALTLQPLSVYAVSITTSVLNETPLQGLNPVKPNIMYTLDDSGSMAWDFLPDSVAYTVPEAPHCRDGLQCGGATAPPPDNTFRFTTFDPPVRSSSYNGLFYSPTATYRPGKNADLTLRPCEGTDTSCGAPWTSVYQDGFAGYPGPNTGVVIDLTAGYPDTVWCRVANPTAADLQDADIFTGGLGLTCRKNGLPYDNKPVGVTQTTVVAAGYNYPNNSETCSGLTLCKFVYPFSVTGNAYYYTIAQVQYCSARDASGWGTSPCVSQWDAKTYKYVRYGTGAATFDPKAFTRVDIRPSSFMVNGVAAANPSGRTYAQEMTNFAEWYAFYRTRVLALKTAGGIAFSALNEDNARVGFHTLWENSDPNAGFLDIVPFNSANKDVWFKHFYAVSPANGTPLPDALYRIGEYFSHSGNSGLSNVDPLDPVTGMCQPNYHLLSTDGYWNYVLSNSVGDQDGNLLWTPPNPVPGFTPGAPLPRPYFEGPTPASNTLSDLAMYYWVRDLRPDLANKVQDSVAPWQHVVLYGLSIGAQGSVPYPSGVDDITAGTRDWPTPLNGAPGQYLGSTPGPEAIDDLWHAAVNSRGKFFNAKTAQDLASSIVQALSEFTGQAGTGTGVGIAGAQLAVTTNYAYRTSYEIGWWGDVKKYALDPTGALPVDNAGNPLNPALWSAATQADTQAAVTGWDTNRRILTINDKTNLAVPFRYANLSPAQQASLNQGWVNANVLPTPTGQSVLNFLRGDPSNEGVSATNFRIRSHTLGTFVYSAAVPVGVPKQPYNDVGNPGYQNFITSKQNRTPMVYAGGNDGMLHAFIDSTTTDAGKEAWAYVPKTLFFGGNPNDTTHTPDPAYQIGALSYGFSGAPLFSPKFYVNATPRVWDVDFANTNNNGNPPTSGSGDWRTILVGGLGAGGRAVYALDVTTPVALTDSESTIASSGRVLWEFTNDNLGYVYDAPTLVKTYAYGWVVLIPSGYNNPGGVGKLFVVDPKTGNLLQTLSTGVGSDADPSGLSTIRAFAPSRKDPYVLQAYGGDIKGNVWRFDLSNSNPANWKVELIAKLKDGAGNAQPVTTGVRIEIDQNNFVDRYIFVGTGQLLGAKDIKDTSVTNSLYVIRDGTVTAPDPAPATPYSRSDLNTVVGTVVAGFSGTATGRGWYSDAAVNPVTGLRDGKIGTDVYADVNTVVYSFTYPSTDPCAPPLSSTLYARDLLTGNSVLISQGGGVVPSIDIGAGIAGVALIQSAGGTVSSAGSGDVRVQVTTMKGQVFSFGVNLVGAANLKHRVSWRLLNRD
jgi:type IV pilus assembly protein PilY1